MTDSLNHIATLLKGTGDPLRLEVLRALKTDSFGVLELCAIFDIKQSGMSHHLKVLANSGAVTRQREGNSIFYCRPLVDTRQSTGQLLAALFLAVDSACLPAEIEGNIQTIKKQRAEAARAFFNKHANQFKKQQELIAPYEQYAETSKDLLLHTQPQPQHCILEIGPGEGAFLNEISPLCNTVIALDISEEMLEKSQQFANTHKLGNVEFILGDTQKAVEAQLHADRIVCNMVLHHVPSPADVFNDSAKLLKQGGSLIVADLCRHDQQWAQDNCGDLWLGFDPDELTRLANNAGFEDKESLFLGLRNGFQVQVRRFDKKSTHSLNTTTHPQG